MARPVTQLKVQPLWARVDSNRTKLAVFIFLFVFGSALLLDLALVALPGSLLSLVFAEDTTLWFVGLTRVFGIAFLLMLLAGGFIAAVQLSNAEDWVTARFPAYPGEGHAGISAAIEALGDMSLAAGLPEPPRVIVLQGDGLNALAVGTSRKRPLIGISERMLAEFSPDEIRAVLATLIARICAGDILFGTALAALMGPLKAIRESGSSASGALGAAGDGCAADPGCFNAVGNDGCSNAGCLLDGLGDSDDAAGCAGAAGIAIFLMLVALITYIAVVSAAWIVTLWGRALHRTGYEKADAEGMLLLKDPAPMLSALRKAIDASNEVGNGDPSYDGILYAATSGRPGVDRREKRRYDRLREVVGTEGLAAPEAGAPAQ